MMRVMLYEAAQSMLRSKKWSWLKEMVMAQGLGDADRQASRNEEGDCGPGAPIGRDHAPNRRILEFHQAVERCPSRDDG